MKRTHSICLTALFCGALFLGAIFFWCLPDQGFSITEKRGLQSLPHLRPATLFSGDFASDMNDYFADQFPERDFFVGFKGLCEAASGKGENNGILLGKNGQLARKSFDVRRADGTICADMDHFDPAHADGAAEGIARMLNNAKIPTLVLLPPRTLDVAKDAFRYPTEGGTALPEYLAAALAEQRGYLDLTSLYRAKYAQNEYVYYKTDHHWTTLGAYYAYAEILRAYGMENEIISQDAFEKQVVTTDFYGTFWASAGMKFVRPDTVEVWYLGNEDQFEVTADGARVDSLYNMAHLKNDPYAVFLDGTHDVVTVTSRDKTRPRLVIFKDSFANALAPFLAQHFDLVLLNLSSVKRDFTDVSALATAYDADAVLILYTLGNVIGTDLINRLQ